jgi:hypothetical protein
VSREWAFRRRHALRATAELVLFGGKTYRDPIVAPGATQAGEHEGDANAVIAVLDYVFGFASQDRGPYVSVGAGYGNISVKPSADLVGQPIGGSGFCYSAGAGYNFTKTLGIEASTIAASTYHSSRQSPIRFFGWRQVSLKYRF